MDEQSSRSLSRKIANDDLVRIDEKLERLHDDVTDQKRPQDLAGRVPRHPVDDPETDEGRPNVTREGLGYGRRGETEPREHRLRGHEQCEAKQDSRDAADLERQARTHGAQSMSSN